MELVTSVKESKATNCSELTDLQAIGGIYMQKAVDAAIHLRN